MNKNNFILLMSLVLFTFNYKAYSASSGGRSSLFKIPVRFNLFTGYQSASGKFSGENKTIKLNSYTIGLDYNVPIPPIKTILGIQFNFQPKAEYPNTIRSLFGFIGVYAGYMNELNDIYLGAGASSFNTYYNDNEASPSTEIKFTSSPSCGFTGYRRYFKKGLSPGIGLSGFYCSASNYTKSIDSVSTKVNSKASISGAALTLFLSWDDTTPLFLL